MSPHLVNANNSPKHAHVPSAVDRVIRPYRPDGFTGAESAMDLYFDFPRFLRGIDSEGIDTTSWDTLDEDFTILLAVLDSIRRRRSERFNVRIRKVQLEGSETASVAEPTICVVVRATRGGCEFLADHEDGRPLERLQPFDIIQFPEGEDPPPRPMTRRDRGIEE